MLARCIKFDQNCSAICFLAAQLLGSGSEFAKQVFTLCAIVCDSSAEECEKHTHMEIVKNALMPAVDTQKLAGKWPNKF